MKRRHALMGLAALAAAPRLADAQPAGKVFRVGYLQGATREQQLHLEKAFVDGLGELGYRDGQNIVIEYRFAGAKLERLPALAAELVRLNPDAILTGTNQTTFAVRQATTTIPIVMAFGNNPVAAGLIASLARPGGNVTGMSGDAGDVIVGKRLQLLKEILPKLTRVAVLRNGALAPNQGRLELTSDAARKLGLQVLSIDVSGPGDLEPAFDAMVKRRAEALLLLEVGPLQFNYRNQIGALASRHRLPAMADAREMAAAGLLMSYGWYQRQPAHREASIMRLSLVSESPLRRARLPMAAVAARNSGAESARDLGLVKRPISIATRMRIMRFCASSSVAKRAAVSGLTGIEGRAMVFMVSSIRNLPSMQSPSARSNQGTNRRMHEKYITSGVTSTGDRHGMPACNANETVGASHFSPHFTGKHV